MMRSLPGSVLCIAALLASVCCERQGPRLYKETRAALYTVVSVTVSADNEASGQSALNAAFGEMERIAGLLNFYSDASEISRVNRQAGISPVAVSPETLEIIRKALTVAALTEGAFDVTVGPVVKLWDFKNAVIPDRPALIKALSTVGYRKILLDEAQGTVYLTQKGMQIDLGGILKGYAADRAVEVLRKNGISSGIVAVGGEVKAFGRRPGGEYWNVGIKNPRQKGPDDEILATVRLSEQAISTSGDYEKFFNKNGNLYHHILDPRTGFPSPGCRSVTIVTRESALADALATGIFVLGPQRGLAVLEENGFDGVIVDEHGSIHVTAALKDSVRFQVGPN